MRTAFREQLTTNADYNGVFMRGPNRAKNRSRDRSRYTTETKRPRRHLGQYPFVHVKNVFKYEGKHSSVHYGPVVNWSANRSCSRLLFTVNLCSVVNADLSEDDDWREKLVFGLAMRRHVVIPLRSPHNGVCTHVYVSARYSIRNAVRGTHELDVHSEVHLHSKIKHKIRVIKSDFSPVQKVIWSYFNPHGMVNNLS